MYMAENGPIPGFFTYALSGSVVGAGIFALFQRKMLGACFGLYASLMSLVLFIHTFFHS